jgi:hypothetical protein
MPQYKPPVGMPCQYFRSSDKPTAAQITAIDNGGMVVLRITPSEGSPFNQRFVFHKDDPMLEDRPADWRAIYGVWDYIPGTPKLGFTEDAPEEPKAVVQPAPPASQTQRNQPTGPLQRTSTNR